jgi:hypothetical protein
MVNLTSESGTKLPRFLSRSFPLVGIFTTKTRFKECSTSHASVSNPHMHICTYGPLTVRIGIPQTEALLGDSLRALCHKKCDLYPPRLQEGLTSRSPGIYGILLACVLVKETVPPPLDLH